MKHIELHIKPALMFLLREAFIRDLQDMHENYLFHNTDYEFYEWLLKKEFISQMEYERLTKEPNPF